MSRRLHCRLARVGARWLLCCSFALPQVAPLCWLVDRRTPAGQRRLRSLVRRGVYYRRFAGRVTPGGPCVQSDAFTITFFDGSLAYLLRLGDRLYLTPKVLAGWTLMDPAPISGRTNGVNVGAGVGIEYATSMDHFTIGADVVGRYILGANIPTVSIYPRVKYTF